MTESEQLPVAPIVLVPAVAPGEPAPSAAADSRTVVALLASPRLRAPIAAVTRAVSNTGSGPRRTIARPANGSTISAATAKTARTSPAVMAPSPRTCAT